MTTENPLSISITGDSGTEKEGRKRTSSDKKSVQQTSKQFPGSRSKTDARHWLDKVYKGSVTRDGQRIEVGTYTVKIQFMGKRFAFGLHTSDKGAAAKKAAAIYSEILRDGWEPTLARYAPSHAPKPKRSATVGEYIAAAKEVSTARARTFADYSTMFRRIASDIEQIPGSRSRFAPCGDGREKWLKLVDKISLASLTPAAVQAWMVAYVRAAGGDPLKEKSATVSANSIVRQAKGLFSKDILESVRATIDLPDPLPFDGVKFFKKPSMRYSSKIDAEELAMAAFRDLPDTDPEAFKIFILAISAGLRAGEIDALLWRQIDLDRGTVSIETTEFFRPKSEASAGTVELDGEIVEILRGYRARASGAFVIESNNDPLPGASYPRQRASDAFQTLYKWLRGQGVTAKKPLHEMRKEYGSLICQKAGVYVASRLLRHGDVATTASHYLDRKERVTVGLGQFFKAAAKVVPIGDGEAASA